MTGALLRNVKDGSRPVNPRDVLTASPEILNGVSSAGAGTLALIEIGSVFDLAASSVFARAAMIAAGANAADALSEDGAIAARFGRAPSDAVKSADAQRPLADLAASPPDVLQGISKKTATELERTLGVESVRDLAAHPAYRAALELVGEVLDVPTADHEPDPEAPDDLVPRSRHYPTERVFYETLLFDRYLTPDAARSQSTDKRRVASTHLDTRRDDLVPLELAGPVDFVTSARESAGYTHAAIGAVLRFSQSWIGEGVALGHLLHSVALAPGESTRIAMIDWARRSSGRQTDSVSQTESLQNVTAHSRAISEVTSAVATESQSGFSHTKADSSSSEFGLAGGALLPTPGIALVGGSYGSASSTTSADGFSISTGRRDLAASMTQQINEATQQAANSARNRRASVVREVSEQESEAVTTRVVTNYNHMHALSVQYYEVVQLYRAVTELLSADRCIFIPFQLLDFRDASLVYRYREPLAAAALDSRIRTVLSADANSVSLTAPPAAGGAAPWDANQAASVAAAIGRPVQTGSATTVQVPSSMQVGVTGKAYGRDGENVHFIAVKADLRDGRRVTRWLPWGGSDESGDWPRDGNYAASIDVSDVRRLILAVRPNPIVYDEHAPATDTFQLSFALGFSTGTQDGFTLSLSAEVPSDGTQEVVVDFEGGTVVYGELLNHLEANRVHYSQAVWRSLSTVDVAATLSRMAIGNRRLLEVIDPLPVATAGNYLVFRLRLDPDESWTSWLSDHDIVVGHREETLVPLPSGGVFAEAVLGRFNSAEKIDLTRFWDWQESPIPIQAPDIAPIATGSRHAGEPLAPGDLAAPLVNIVSPTSLPDPTGLAAALGAIQNGGMFRDMSGLAAVAGLAQAGLNATSEGASHAADAAAANLKTFADLLATVASIAAGVPIAGFGGGSSAPMRSNTGTGGAFVLAEKMDQRAAANGGAVPSAPRADDGIEPPAPITQGAPGPHAEEAFGTVIGRPPKQVTTSGGGGGKQAPKPAKTVRVSLRAYYPDAKDLDGTFDLALENRATGKVVNVVIDTSFGTGSAVAALDPGVYAVKGVVVPAGRENLSAEGDVALIGGDTLHLNLPLAVDATAHAQIRPTGGFTLPAGATSVLLKAVPTIEEFNVSRTIQLDASADASAEFKQELAGKIGGSIEILELELAASPSVTFTGTVHGGAQQSVTVEGKYKRLAGMVIDLDKVE